MTYGFELISDGEKMAGLVVANSFVKAMERIVENFGEDYIDKLTSLEILSDKNIVLLPTDSIETLFNIVVAENG